MKVRLIPSDESKPIRDVWLTGTDSVILKHLQKMVGGYITPISLATEYCMLVDEEALLKSETPPLNLRAMEIAGRHGKVPSPLVGDAILVGLMANPIEEEGGYVWGTYTGED